MIVFDTFRWMEKLQPNIILMETKRPDGRGIELVKAIASMPWKPVLIVLTSYEDNDERIAATAAGASKYLLKTIDRTEILRMIKQYSAAV